MTDAMGLGVQLLGGVMVSTIAVRVTFLAIRRWLG